MPTGGCNAISDEGACFTSFASSGINWGDARQKCLSRGYDFATVTSMKENSLVYSTAPTQDCWIGLHDRDTEGTFVWDDGSDSLFRNWGIGEPNQNGNEDCVHIWSSPRWNDLPCTVVLPCYICRASGKHLFYVRIR